MKTTFYLGGLLAAMLWLAACKEPPLKPTTIDIESPVEPDTVKSVVTALVNGKPWKFVTPDTVSLGAYDNNGNLHRRDEPLYNAVLAQYDKVLGTPFSLRGGGLSMYAPVKCRFPLLSMAFPLRQPPLLVPSVIIN